MSRNSNKTAEILRLIQTKKVATLGDLSSNKHLLSVFASSAKATPRRRIIDTAALLARQGYVSVGLLDNEKVFKITEKGKARLKAQRSLASIRSRIKTLSPREYEVFRWVIAGSLNKQTAFEMGITEKTVKLHRSMVMQKMKANSVAELTILADRAGVEPMRKAGPKSG